MATRSWIFVHFACLYIEVSPEATGGPTSIFSAQQWIWTYRWRNKLFYFSFMSLLLFFLFFVHRFMIPSWCPPFFPVFLSSSSPNPRKKKRMTIKSLFFSPYFVFSGFFSPSTQTKKREEVGSYNILTSLACFGFCDAPYCSFFFHLLITCDVCLNVYIHICAYTCECAPLWAGGAIAFWG